MGQLLRTVNACHLQFVLNAMRHNRHAIGHRPLHHIGEVVLTLCILVVEFGQPSFELFGGHGHDAAVHLLNFQLLWAGIFLLHDGQHAVAFCCAHNAAVACWVGHVEGEQGQAINCRSCLTHTGHQGFERVGVRQGHIARQHHHQAIICQHWHRLLHGMPCTQLRLLSDKFDGQFA